MFHAGVCFSTAVQCQVFSKHADLAFSVHVVVRENIHVSASSRPWEVRVTDETGYFLTAAVPCVGEQSEYIVFISNVQ